MDGLKTAYFWSMCVVVTTFFVLIASLLRLATLLLRLPDNGRANHRINTIWGRTIIRLMPGWKVSVEGEGKIGRAHV